MKILMSSLVLFGAFLSSGLSQAQFNFGYGVWFNPYSNVNLGLRPQIPFYGHSFDSYWYNNGYNYRNYTVAAISYSYKTNRVGLSNNNFNRNYAFEDSQYACGVEDCRKLVWVKGGCATLVLGRFDQRKKGSDEPVWQNAVYYGYATSKRYADRNAKRACRKDKARNCTERAWVCSHY